MRLMELKTKLYEKYERASFSAETAKSESDRVNFTKIRDGFMDDHNQVSAMIKEPDSDSKRKKKSKHKRSKKLKSNLPSDTSSGPSNSDDNLETQERDGESSNLTPKTAELKSSSKETASPDADLELTLKRLNELNNETAKKVADSPRNKDTDTGTSNDKGGKLKDVDDPGSLYTGTKDTDTARNTVTECVAGTSADLQLTLKKLNELNNETANKVADSPRNKDTETETSKDKGVELKDVADPGSLYTGTKDTDTGINTVTECVAGTSKDHGTIKYKPKLPDLSTNEEEKAASSKDKTKPKGAHDKVPLYEDSDVVNFHNYESFNEEKDTGNDSVNEVKNVFEAKKIKKKRFNKTEPAINLSSDDSPAHESQPRARARSKGALDRTRWPRRKSRDRSPRRMPWSSTGRSSTGRSSSRRHGVVNGVLTIDLPEDSFELRESIGEVTQQILSDRTLRGAVEYSNEDFIYQNNVRRICKHFQIEECRRHESILHYIGGEQYWHICSACYALSGAMLHHSLHQCKKTKICRIPKGINLE